MEIVKVHVFFALPSSHLLCATTEQLPEMKLAPKSPKIDSCILATCNLVHCSGVQALGEGRVLLEISAGGTITRHVLEPDFYLLARHETGNLIASSPRLCYDCGQLAESHGIDFNTDTATLDEMFECPHCFNRWHIPKPTEPEVINEYYNQQHRRRFPAILGLVAGTTRLTVLLPPPLPLPISSS